MKYFMSCVLRGVLNLKLRLLFVNKIDTKCKRICALRIKSSDELNAIIVVYIYAMRHTEFVTMCR